MAETDSAESLVTAAVQSDQHVSDRSRQRCRGGGQTGTALTQTWHWLPDQDKLPLPVAAFAET